MAEPGEAPGHRRGAGGAAPASWGPVEHDAHRCEPSRRILRGIQADRDSPPSPVAGLLLTHGAGGGADQHTLVALAEGLDMPVRRIEFGYRREGRRFPDRAPRLIAEVRSAAEAFAAELGTTTARLVLGGRSMGGRMCSMAVAGGLPAAGLVLLSYPLHPPGKPDKLRVDHFGDIAVPALFVSGDRDPFGTPEEFAAHLGAITGSVTVHWLERQGHDPRPGTDPETMLAVADFLQISWCDPCGLRAQNPPEVPRAWQ